MVKGSCRRKGHKNGEGRTNEAEWGGGGEENKGGVSWAIRGCGGKWGEKNGVCSRSTEPVHLKAGVLELPHDLAGSGTDIEDSADRLALEGPEDSGDVLAAPAASEAKEILKVQGVLIAALVRPT